MKQNANIYFVFVVVDRVLLFCAFSKKVKGTYLTYLKNFDSGFSYIYKLKENGV